jgi:hypothetical protein
MARLASLFVPSFALDQGDGHVGDHVEILIDSSYGGRGVPAVLLRKEAVRVGSRHHRYDRLLPSSNYCFRLHRRSLDQGDELAVSPTCQL